jgi:beta-lactamase regulating signal transducer with metallopeptidase domain
MMYWKAGVVADWNAAVPSGVLRASAKVIHPPASGSRDAMLSQELGPDLFPLVVEVWLAGVALFSLRSAGGFFVLARMRQRESLPVASEVQEVCMALQRRLGLNLVIRYAQCQWLHAPAVIGWFRPIVFLPLTALTGLSEAQLQAVIAHELAHIRRLDSLVNAFQVMVETLLFYHPAVWWLNKRIRVERENCCDDVAIALCGNAVDYARALTLMAEWRVAPSFAMAANRGPLSARIGRLLGIRSLRSGLRGVGLTSSVLCLTIALVSGNAIFGMAHVAIAQSVPATPTPFKPANPAKPPSPPKPEFKSKSNGLPTPPSAPVTPPSPATVPSVPATPATPGSYVEEMRAAGLGSIDVDELIALKVQGVTADYVRGIQQQGVRPDVDEIIAMKVQGVTPEFIRNVRATGMTVSGDEIIAMKVQGVDENYLHGMRDMGLKLDADELIGMKVQGVTPDYLKSMKAAGIELNGDEIVAMRVQGVTPQYVQEIRALGFKPSADDIIAMRVQSVTPEYIKAMQAAGLKFDIDELVGAKVQGVTPEFIEKVRQHGFKDLTLEKLIQLRHLGVLDKDGEI